jgi:exopolysaccharide biosynthesis polyprenyl glycosylphosphotransferase
MSEPTRPVIDRGASSGRHKPELRLLREPFTRRKGESSPAQAETNRVDDRGLELLAPMRSRGSIAEAMLLGTWDLFATLLALVLTGAFGGGVRGSVVRVLVSLGALVFLRVAGAYRRTAWLREHPLELIGQLLVASTALAWGGVLVTMALGLRYHLGPLVISWLVLPVAWFVGRRVAKRLRVARPERILIVGTGIVAERVIELSRRVDSTSLVVGCLDDGESRHRSPDGPPLIGGIDQLPRVLAQGGVDRVIVAFSERSDHETLDVLRSCASYHGAVDIVPRFFDFVGPRVGMYSDDGMAFLSIPARHMGRGGRIMKRAFDMLAASVLLVALAPLLAVIAMAILVDSGGPVLFRQRRIGMHGTTFSILKFRTLTPADGPVHDPGTLALTPGSIAAHVEQAKQEASRRATRVGAFLRKTSLDELPQLLNVLVGQMSLVGPRPLSPLEDAALDGWESLRRDVRPGITGLWQVSGRSEISWENRINMDYSQVRHWSLASDLQVLIDTVRAVWHRRGAE